MCGILGAVKNQDSIDRENFNKLNRLQSHRGPDGEGLWFGCDDHVALGHRRLSIIDLKQGGQPMSDPDSGLVLVYNGEIYNYRELGSELKAKGHSFRTNSDTEVLLRSYLEWGSGCLLHLRGMFAFAVVDPLRQELFLARDPIGIKPLVYASGKGIFCFASEIRTLANIGNLDLQPDLHAIDLYLALQYIPAPTSVFHDVKKLPPGHFMRVGFDGSVKEIKRYWQARFRPRSSKTAQEWQEELDAKLSESVRYHTVSDVDYGAFLSGGIDSTLVVKNLSRFRDHGLKTFSIGVDSAELDETGYACLAAQKYGTDHFQQSIGPWDYMDNLDAIARVYGEPFGDSSAIPAFFVSKLASRQVKVVLSGDGADELFGGYNLYNLWCDLRHKKESRPLYLNIARGILSRLLPQVYVPERHDLPAWMNLLTYYTYRQRKALWREGNMPIDVAASREFDCLRAEFKRSALTQKAQLYDLSFYLPNDMLVKIDIASMRHGLESRVPFIDREVVDLALEIPEELNIPSQEGQNGKLLLKKMLLPDFGPQFVNRQKQGFGVPLADWFSAGGDLYNEPYMRLLNPRSRLFYKLFSQNGIFDMLSRGEHYKTHLLLILEAWLHYYEQEKKARIKI